MKKVFSLFFYGCFFALYCQDHAVDRQAKIENGLSPNLRFKDQPTWKIRDRMSHYRVPGATVAVIEDYRLDWAKGYGTANEETGETVSINTAFQAASISKTVNAIGVLKWAETNSIDLQTDINTLLKGWKVDSEKTITLYQLLTHTAGLSVHGFLGYTSNENLPSTIQILEGEKPANNKKVRPQINPGQEFKYSGGGTTILQLLIEEQVGNYASYMKETIFDPLGMGRTFYPDQLIGSVSMSHDRKGKRRRNGYNIYPELAAAALWTTPSDLASLLIELQLTLAGKSEKILSITSVRALTTPWKEGQANAAGTFIDSEGSIKYFQHSGGNEGFNCLYYASMEQGHGAIVMINSEKFDLIHEIMRGIAEIYEWESYLPTVVSRKEVPGKDELKSYEGTYRSVDSRSKTVNAFVKKGTLYIEQKKRWKSQLVPQGGNKFITKDIQPAAIVTFEKDQAIIQQGENGELYVWKKE